MTQSTTTGSDAAESAEFERLVQGLEWTDGFGLFFVECDTAAAERRIADRLRAAIDRPMLDVNLPAGEPDPYATVTAAAEDSPAGAIMLVHGLTTLLSSAPRERSRKTSAWLNWRRPDYGKLARPLVFFLSPGSVTTLAREAPDFFDWNSGVYVLDAALVEAAPERSVTLPDFGEFSNMPLVQKREALDRLTHLEEQYAGDTPAALRARAGVTQQLGKVLASMGEYARARDMLRRSRDAYRALGDDRGCARIAFQLAVLDVDQGALDRALHSLQQEVLPVYERLGDVRERAVTLGTVADILRVQGELDEALRIRREEELPVYERLGARQEILVGRANLAITYLMRDHDGDREQATELLYMALAEAEEMRTPEAEQIRATLQQVRDLPPRATERPRGRRRGTGARR